MPRPILPRPRLRHRPRSVVEEVPPAQLQGPPRHYDPASPHQRLSSASLRLEYQRVGHRDQVHRVVWAYRLRCLRRRLHFEAASEVEVVGRRKMQVVRAVEVVDLKMRLVVGVEVRVEGQR